MTGVSKIFPPGEAPAAEARAEAALARELAPDSAPLDISLDEAPAEPGRLARGAAAIREFWRHVPLGPAVALLAASIVLLAGNLISLALVPDFHWRRFFAVAKWTLLAYLIIAGLIEYSFLRDHIRGGVLVILTLSLVVFAVHVPMLVGFTVARYDDEPEPALG